MDCISCNGKTKVTDVRNRNGKRYRRRTCLECGERFTTYELNYGAFLDALDEHLPVTIVDDISNVLSMEMPEHQKTLN